MLKGLIFDLDGVITDSAVYHLKAWQDLARGIGIELPEEFGDKLRGLSRMDSLEIILEYGHKENDYSQEEKEALAAKKNAAYVNAVKIFYCWRIILFKELAKNGGCRLKRSPAVPNNFYCSNTSLVMCVNYAISSNVPLP